jgi:glycosyltransferase involved in cell wall biosynthesis
MVVRFIYNHTDLILIQSEGFRNPINALIRNPGKVTFYPNSVDLDLPPAASQSPAVESLATLIGNCFSVVFTGNLGTAQSLDTILNAAEQLRGYSDICFFLIGSGSKSDWLASEIPGRGLNNVVLGGPFPQDAMAHLYAPASALLVSLTAAPIFRYTIPSKVQSYMAAGRPIIASLNGEGARIVTEANAGLTCAAGNADELAKSVLQLRSLSPQVRRQMGDNSRQYAEAHFSLRRLTDVLIERLQNVVAVQREGQR